MTDLAEKRVSIVVPVYNGEPYIETCVNSLTAQTHSNLEIITVNDGSNDATLEKLNKLASDPRLVIVDKKNEGVSSARNEGIRQASGEFILFVDADDHLQPDAVEELLCAQEKSQADIVVLGFRNFGYNIPEDATLIFEEDTYLNHQDIVDYVKQYLNRPNKHSLFVYSWGRLFKTEKIKNSQTFFNEGLISYEDVWFNFDMLNFTDSIFYLSKPLYNYRRHQMLTSATTKLVGDPKGFFAYVYALESARKYMLKHCPDADDVNQWHGNACVTYTIIQLIRLCGNINRHSFWTIRKYICKLMDEKWLRESLRHYRPRPGDSVAIPRLIGWRQALAIMWVGYRKAHKRYG